jgi:CheY-like chemotaxis protein
MTILYIDDDQEDQELFSEAMSLVDPNIALLLATGGREGLRVLEQSAALPDLLFVDLNMPGDLNGREVVGKIRNDDRLRKIPLLIYTTSVHRTDREQSLAVGANDYLVKPNGFKEICALLKQTINKYRP